MIFACASAFDQKDFISEGSKNFLGAMVAANIAEVGAGVTDINDVVQAVHKHVKTEKKHLPVGEGAYQDPKAVMQRTTDKNTHCEDGKWKQQPAPTRSGAMYATGTSLVVALLIALVQ